MDRDSSIWVSSSLADPVAIKELDEFFDAVPACSLRYIAGDRHCASTHLGDNSVDFCFWVGLGGFVDLLGQAHCGLPDFQVFMRFHFDWW